MTPFRCFEEYERRIAASREAFANSPAVQTLLSRVDPKFLHAFLLHFSALGVPMTEPVEGWIRRASEKCDRLGLASITRVLARHAQAESGHHLMMMADVKSLADLWNRNFRPRVDAQALIAHIPSPGVARYRKVHEDNLAGTFPFAQIAIEYEIEMLPLRFGTLFLTRAAEVLGPEIISCLSFITSHVELDVAHTKTNAWAMAEVCRELPGSVPVLAAAGAAILDAYSQYLDDCISLAEQQSRDARPLDIQAISPSALTWSFSTPQARFDGYAGSGVPNWLEEVRALRSFVLFDSGRRPAFRSQDGLLRDDDPIDLHSYHFVAYDGPMLVGCLRMHQLSDGMRCLTETIMGEDSFATLLRGLGVERTNVIEFGRWIVHPSYRDGGRVGVWLAAAAGALAIRLAHGSVAKHGIVICSVGTVDRQGLILQRIGLRTAPIRPIACERYSDHLQVMYCTDLRQLDDRFCVLMDEMAQRVRLRPN